MRQTHDSPVAKAEMLIRRPVAEVFEAFVNPAITSKFWFSKGSGRLEAGKQVVWEWEMYDFSVQVYVKAVDPNARILVEWSAYGPPTSIEWVFTARPDGTTFVGVTNRGFPGNEVEAAQHALDATEGFAFVLAGAKASLEHNIQLNLVPDRFPEGLAETVPEPVGDASKPEAQAPTSPDLPDRPEDWPSLFEQHLSAGNLDAVMALYEPAARFVAPSGETIVGRDRLREVVAGLIKAKTKLNSQVVKAITLDNVTLLYTDFHGTTVDPSGEIIELRHNAIEVLRRQPDGTWKLIMGTSKCTRREGGLMECRRDQEPKDDDARRAQFGVPPSSESSRPRIFRTTK